ncbi:hypothetical protein SAMN05216571_11476 [Onishia taeanensis]|jgi:hypothetical protein|uniref:Uncharacterized protein n=1 Tax=Onishia taeanensis TaxID=284577 RepID=A0A1G7UFN9_9GAMM|nr:hypothetical protein [Halomonas taeanensis]SDG46382.1 hypothetical protein SAMN05216571_11476 [Halomonas taeanensis]
MPYQIDTRLKGANPSLQIRDSSSGSVRLAWEYPRQAASEGEDEELLALKREEAIHELFRRLFLLTTEQYLKGEAGDGEGTRM